MKLLDWESPLIYGGEEFNVAYARAVAQLTGNLADVLSDSGEQDLIRYGAMPTEWLFHIADTEDDEL